MKLLFSLLFVSGLYAQTGIVFFFDGSSMIGTANVVNGSAKLQTSSLTPGVHALTASYQGDTQFSGSTSQALVQAVAQSSVPPPIFQLSSNGTVGIPYLFQLNATNNPTNYVSTGLPPGLSINQSGAVSGTPSVAGGYNATLSASNAGGSGSIALSLTIAPGAPPGVNISSITSPVILGNPVTITGSGFAPNDIIWFTSAATGTFGLNVTSNGSSITFNTNGSFKRGTFSLYVQNSTVNSNLASLTVN